jgi:solute carrier family 35 protein C2
MSLRVSQPQSQSTSLSDEARLNDQLSDADVSPGKNTPGLDRPSFSDDEDLQDDEETGLTDKEKRRRRRKRRRNTMLDQRVARSKDGLSAEERKEADKGVVKSLLINGGLILLWYIFSLSISVVSFPCFISHFLPLGHTSAAGHEH